MALTARIIRIGALASALIVLVPVCARAEDGDDRLLRLGSEKFKIMPQFATQLVYDTNIARVPRNRQDDLISQFSPGVTLNYQPTAKMSWDASYTLRGNVFAIHDEQDSLEHFLATHGHWQPGRLYLDYRTGFNKTESPLGQASEPSPKVGLEFDRRLEVEQSLVAATVGYEFNRFALELGYRRDGFLLLQHDLIDFNHHSDSVGVTGIYHLTGKTDLLGELGWSHTDFVSRFKNDYETWSGKAGVRGRITEKLQLTLEVGGKATQFESHPTLAAAGRASMDTSDFSGLVATLAATYELSARDTITATYLRDQIDSVRSNYLVQDRVALDLSHTFTGRWSARAGGAYEHEHESLTGSGAPGWKGVSKADSDWMDVHAGVTYDLRKWWTLDLSYAYESRFSGDRDLRFDDNRVTLGSTIRF